jgi:hypothetical protein
VLCCWDPKAGLPVTERLVLVRKVHSLTTVSALAALGKRARTDGKLRADGSILSNPVGQSVFTVLDDAMNGISAQVSKKE